MKQWLDEVFVHGFAHGSTAKLGGKKLILSFTTGAPQALYTMTVSLAMPLRSISFPSRPGQAVQS